MKTNRREFLVLPGAAAANSLLGAGAPGIPWHQRIRRVGQVNMTERDPVELNVEEWANYWASLKVDAVMVSVTGILAFYQTKVPFHRKGQFLGDRDFFGDCCAAAKKRGLHVIARLSPDLNWEDAVKAHPEWFRRNSEGEFVHHGEDPRLFATCMYSTYFTDYITAIMREVNSLYDVDGIFTNAWPPLGRPPVCYCDQCRKLERPGTPEYWDQFNQRCVYLWKLYDAIAKEKKPDNLFFANLGGSIRATPNLKTLGEICYWFNCDNQGRGGDDTPIWGCTMQGRVCQAAMKGRTSTNVTAAWSTGSPRWRNVAKSPAEAQMWMDETVASGMVPWYHFIGGQNGLGEDRRWHEPGRQFFNWLAKHDRHFVNKRSIANLGVVMGQRTHLFYRPPSGVSVSDNMNGLYYALVEGRFLFDFVHEDDLGPETLKKYSALLLPNTALLSDGQCGQLRAYVEAGGSLLATFETSMFTDRNQRRPDFGLADVFGIHQARNITGTNGNAYYARIMRPHPILDGFTGTNWIPGAEFRLPVTPVENPVLTVVPGYVAYPPELSYPPIPRTDEPAVVIREKGRSRLVYFPGDVERTSWRSGHTDLSRLLQNSIRWLAGPDAPVTLAGDGVIESFAWETEAGFALHVLNYTNPAMHKGSIRRFYPIGPQKVRMKLPAARKVSRVELLRAEKDLPFRQTNATIEFTIPSVADYEVAALYSE
ncbi:MAG: beta-galactosidase trimerization domain-containing protein [Bryobacterales bacterium]|nr:beta-galactosidase trimerization domain-containing protein [Bryobacterales bacterium]